MRNIKTILCSLAVGAFLISCDEGLDKVTFNGGGTAPVLTVSSTDDLVLDKTTPKFSSLQFQWTNPDYEFSNGVNTHDITYTLQVDTTGSNFSNPKISTKTISKDLTASFNVKDFNSLLAGLELKDYVPHNFEFRIMASMSSKITPLYSNVIKIKATTYLDVVYPVPNELFITGSATPKDWMKAGDAPVPAQKFTKINAYSFVIESLDIIGNNSFLFVPVYGSWSDKYGFTGANNTNNQSGDSFRPGGGDIKAPSSSKAYKITVNFKTGKYSIQ